MEKLTAAEDGNGVVIDIPGALWSAMQRAHTFRTRLTAQRFYDFSPSGVGAVDLCIVQRARTRQGFPLRGGCAVLDTSCARLWGGVVNLL